MGQFFNVMFGPVVTLLLMTGRENDVLKATIVSTATLLITCFVLIPLFGALGAALACCVSIILLNIFCAMYVYKHLKLVTLLLLFRRV
jgi:O-antigen/teichoic acid export membrane protein